MNHQEDFKRAQNGNSSAQAYLGWMYAVGRGVPKDDAEAVKWYRLAAAQENAWAQDALANMYLLGRGVTKDDAEAVKWARLAAAQGTASAQDTLAMMYLLGRGVTTNDSEAAKWARLAVAQGYAGAQVRLGSMYMDGRGVPKDDAEAVKLFRLAAAQGDAEGQVSLAKMYLLGCGIPKDDAEAVKWYRLAAAQGHAEGQNGVGYMYGEGRGVPKDDAVAVRLYRLSVAQGYASAQCNLGWMYAEGRGVPKDDAEAVRLYRLAASQGHAGAQDRLTDLLLATGDSKCIDEILQLCRLGSANEPDRSERISDGMLDLVVREIDRMTGLAEVKAEIRKLIAVSRTQQKRRKAGMKTNPFSLHLVFTGRPGTGKTTVARYIGRIYAALGFLSKGHLVEAHRQDLVAEWIGQTAPKVKKKIEEALDGVLFIDEAYSLVPPDSMRDFGHEAIATLIAEMENNRDRLAVIVAGYSDEMSRFVEINPGIKSRFNHFIHFEDYSPSELVSIFRQMAGDADYCLSADADEKVQLQIQGAYEIREKDFGNARFVRNLLESTIMMHSLGVERLGLLDETSLRTLVAEDIAELKASI